MTVYERTLMQQMKELGVETMEVKKSRTKRKQEALIADDTASDISKAISAGKQDAALEKEFATKYMSAKAVIGGEDKGHAEVASPRELDESVAPVGEKQYYKGIHQQKDKGLITGGDEYMPLDERYLKPEEKLEARNQLRTENYGAHFDYDDVFDKIIDLNEAFKEANKEH